MLSPRLLLAGHFLAKYSRQMKKNVTGISPSARFALSDYAWPGNVRELENIIQRHVALCEGDVIEKIDLPSSRQQERPAGADSCETSFPPEGINLAARLDDYERGFIREALKSTGGNLTNAAKMLGMSYRSIRYRVKKLGVRSS